MNEINSKSFNINIDKPTIADLEVYFQKHSASLNALRQSMQKATEKIIDLKANETATSLKELLDKDIQNVSNSVSNLENNMNTSFRDGVITEAECISIKNSLLRLDTEKADIDKNYESLYNNVNLSGEAKTNLNSTYTAYVSIHTELVNYVNGVMVDNTATTEEVAEVKNKLNRYNVALSNYKVAQNVAVNSIANAVSNNNLSEYKSLVSKDINDINKKIKNSDQIEKMISDMVDYTTSLDFTPSATKIGIFMNVSEDTLMILDTDFVSIKKKLCTECLPELFIHKQFDGGNEFIRVIATGINLPMEEVSSMYDKYVASTEALTSSSDSFFDKIDNMDTANKLDTNQTTKVNKTDDAFFAQFSTPKNSEESSVLTRNRSPRKRRFGTSAPTSNLETTSTHQNNKFVTSTNRETTYNEESNSDLK